MELDATKAGPEANSYADVDQADDYMESVYGAEEWSSLTDTEKDQLLQTATKTIDRLFVMFPSTTETQTLKFPVNTFNRTDRESRPLGDGYDKAQEATIQQAWYLYQHSDELQETEGNRIQGVTGQKIGQVSRTSSGFNPLATIAAEVWTILNPYLSTSVKATR